jgi:hypothetical protein
MSHTIMLATTSHSANWLLIIGLSVLIALPFISSSIIIPILLKINRHKNKIKRNKIKRISSKKTIKKQNTK